MQEEASMNSWSMFPYGMKARMTRNKYSASLSTIFIKDHVTMLPFIFKRGLCKYKMNYRQYYETI
jgi:hypothetical protein